MRGTSETFIPQFVEGSQTSLALARVMFCLMSIANRQTGTINPICVTQILLQNRIMQICDKQSAHANFADQSGHELRVLLCEPFMVIFANWSIKARERGARCSFPVFSLSLFVLCKESPYFASPLAASSASSSKRHGLP
jgi:hypothetical protein